MIRKKKATKLLCAAVRGKLPHRPGVSDKEENLSVWPVATLQREEKKKQQQQKNSLRTLTLSSPRGGKISEFRNLTVACSHISVTEALPNVQENQKNPGDLCHIGLDYRQTARTTNTPFTNLKAGSSQLCCTSPAFFPLNLGQITNRQLWRATTIRQRDIQGKSIHP